MGKEEVASGKLSFISFELHDGHFVAFLEMEAVINSEKDPELILRQAEKLYERSVAKMQTLIEEIQATKAKHRSISALKIWELGNAVFKLKDDLEKLSLQLDNVYAHLSRDLGVKRKWLEKVVIFRRYLPSKEFVPKSLNWGRCEKGTRRVAERLRKGLPPI
jgi:hypothetical protein